MRKISLLLSLLGLDCFQLKIIHIARETFGGWQKNCFPTKRWSPLSMSLPFVTLRQSFSKQSADPRPVCLWRISNKIEPRSDRAVWSSPLSSVSFQDNFIAHATPSLTPINLQWPSKPCFLIEIWPVSLVRSQPFSQATLSYSSIFEVCFQSSNAPTLTVRRMLF